MVRAETLLQGPAVEMAAAVQRGDVAAAALVDAALAQIERSDGRVNAFTAVLAERARRRATEVDRLPRAAALPLRGVPFAAKNLFDISGLPTLAGSKIEADAAPALHDALLVQRMEAAGAVLVGVLNMDEYAYGFTTENSHHGATHNPHDLACIAGGSSGGSGAALAAGQVPLTLGSDTNGSIRVPSSLCGVFGLKPTLGRLPRTGSYPFVASLDHLGPFARHVADLALAYDLMQGADHDDPACAQRPVELTSAGLAGGTVGLRIGVLGGWFARMAGHEARDAVARVAEALGATQTVEWQGAEAARAAAFLISNSEGASLHLDDLCRRPHDFEPLSRDRFLAGALLPAHWVARAQRVRQLAARQAAALFERFDVLLAPATPCVAPAIGTEWLTIDGQRLPARPSLGLLTQPISCIGLPVCAVPVWGVHATLPIGVQLIAAPWREDRVLRVAAALEAQGVVQAPIAKDFA
jgi:1-carboxybiuret hydrolase